MMSGSEGGRHKVRKGGGEEERDWVKRKCGDSVSGSACELMEWREGYAQ